MTPVVRLTVLGDHDPSVQTQRALDAALQQLPGDVEATWTATDSADGVGPADGVWIAPGSPYADDDAVLAVIAEAYNNRIPLLGTCGGFQYTALVLGRLVAGVPDAQHAELDPDTSDPFIAPLAAPIGGARRTTTPIEGTALAELLGDAPIEGFFTCGYAPTPAAAATLEAAGVRISAQAQDVGAVALELPAADHPFLMATLFHPQLEALDGGPLSPVVAAFADAAREHAARR